MNRATMIEPGRFEPARSEEWCAREVAYSGERTRVYAGMTLPRATRSASGAPAISAEYDKSRFSSPVQAYIVGLVEIHIAEAEDGVIAANLERSRDRRRAGVLSVRLDAGERRALERRAELSGIQPSVLARNLIRVGLAGPGNTALAQAVAGLEDALGKLREVVVGG